MHTEKKGLSKREKLMLLIMVVIGLFAIMVMFVIIPFYEQLSAKTKALSDLEFTKAQIDTTLASEHGIRENYNAVLQQHDMNSARFLNEALSNDIGRMLTVLCENHSLQPIDQKLSAPVDFVIKREGGEESAENSLFLIVSAVMTVRGEYDDLKSLLDTVEGIDYIRISRTSFSRNTYNPESGLDRITVYFEVTMLKNISGPEAPQ